MSNQVEIRVAASGAGGAAAEVEKPGRSLRTVEQSARAAAEAAQRAGAALRGLGGQGAETAARSLRVAAMDAERLASALGRAQAAERSVLAGLGRVSRPAGEAPRQRPPVPEVAGGKLEWDDAVARWSEQVRAAEAAADGLRWAAVTAATGVRGLSGAAGNGTEKMQALGTAMLAMAGGGGALSQAFRAFGAAALSAHGSAKELFATLKGGGMLFAGMMAADRLAREWHDLGVAVGEVNEALAGIGSGIEVSRLDAVQDMLYRALTPAWLRRRQGNPGEQPEAYQMPDEVAAAQDRLRGDQARTWQERMRPKTVHERVAAEMGASGSGWSFERYRQRVEELQAVESAEKRAGEAQDEAARREEARQAARREVGERLWAAEKTGVADPRARRLAEAGVQAWEEAGGGDPTAGLRILEEKWKAEAEALEKRQAIGEHIAETEKRLGEARQQAADEVARAEIAAERTRLQESLRALAESARARMAQAEDLARQEKAARERLLSPATPGQRREARQEQRQERRLERRIEGARERERELLAQGYAPEQARGRMTRRGRELLEYDDLRTRAQEAKGQAEGLAAQEKTERAAADTRLAELREQELELGRQQADETRALTEELGRLREKLAALAGGDPDRAAAPQAVQAAAQAGGEDGGAAPEPPPRERAPSDSPDSGAPAGQPRMGGAPARAEAPVGRAAQPDGTAPVTVPVETGEAAPVRGPQAPEAVTVPVVTAAAPEVRGPQAPRLSEIGRRLESHRIGSLDGERVGGRMERHRIGLAREASGDVTRPGRDVRRDRAAEPPAAAAGPRRSRAGFSSAQLGRGSLFGSAAGRRRAGMPAGGRSRRSRLRDGALVAVAGAEVRSAAAAGGGADLGPLLAEVKRIGQSVEKLTRMTGVE